LRQRGQFPLPYLPLDVAHLVTLNVAIRTGKVTGTY
jgi:hypothetical protein